MSDETGFQRFVSALYVGYYVVLGLGFGLLLSDGLPSPWPPGTASDAAFRYQGASAMVVVITVLHLVLGLYYAEADPTLRRRRGQSWTSWYSATRGNWRDLTADALLLVALVIGIVGLSVPPTASGKSCAARVGTVAYCGGGNVEIPLAALVLASVGNLFCVWSQLASATAAGGAYAMLNGGRGLGGLKRTSESGGWLALRQVVDPLASLVHLVLLITICVSNPGSDRWGSAAGVALILMQVVAIWAHLFYWINLTDSDPPAAWMNMLFWRLGTTGALQDTRNLYKWLEYAVSATLGTVAVFLSSGDQPTNTLLLLVTLSATIQTVGYSLDQVENHAGGTTAVGASSWPELVQWTSAAAGQIVDFIVVSSAVYDHWPDDGDRAVHLVPYIVGWSLFGLWNLWVLVRHRPGDGDDDYVEFWYSVFSLVAKAAVFGSTGFYLGRDPATRVL